MQKLLSGFFLAAIAHFLISGCSSSCPGTEVDGRCETTCEDASCPATFRCLQNACRPPCSTNTDCPSTETCSPVRTDYGAKGLYCYGPSPAPAPTSCKTASDCAADSGQDCIAGKCTPTCIVHSDCGSTGSCTKTATDAAGKSVNLCAPDTAMRGKGQYGTLCPQGDECDTAGGFTCVGTNIGNSGAGIGPADAGARPGDLYAYCTKFDCASDTDCPTGFACHSEMSARQPCTEACGFVGKAGGDCVAAGDIGAGKSFQCGGVGLVTNLCVYRGFCDSCTTDADCLGIAGQVCAKDTSGTKICTVVCDPANDSCPWGGAASCAVTDPALGVATCSHRFGSCHGTGKSCEPCVDEKDCPNGFCQQEPFTSEHYCVDLTANCSCPSGTMTTCLGGGCPLTPAPGSLTMTCYGGSQYVGSAAGGKCIGASRDPGSGQQSSEGCWPVQ